MPSTSTHSKSTRASRKAKRIADKVSNAKTQKLANKAQKVVSHAKDEAEGFVKKAEHRVQEAAEKIGHGAKEIASKVKHVAEEAVEKVKHTAEEAVDTVKEKLSSSDKDSPNHKKA